MSEMKLCPFCGKKVNLLEGEITVQHPYSAHEGDECFLSGFTCDAELWETLATEPKQEGFEEWGHFYNKTNLDIDARAAARNAWNAALASAPAAPAEKPVVNKRCDYLDDGGGCIKTVGHKKCICAAWHSFSAAKARKV